MPTMKGIFLLTILALLCSGISAQEKEKKTNRIDYKIVRNTTILFHLFKQAIWVTGIYSCICGIVH